MARGNRPGTLAAPSPSWPPDLWGHLDLSIPYICRTCQGTPVGMLQSRRPLATSNRKPTSNFPTQWGSYSHITRSAGTEHPRHRMSGLALLLCHCFCWALFWVLAFSLGWWQDGCHTVGITSRCDKIRVKETCLSLCVYFSQWRNFSQKHTERYPSYFLGQNFVKCTCLTRFLARGNEIPWSS